MDVASILSKRDQLSDGISIKPDMTKQEQQTEAILLKERWSISQQGTAKKISKSGHLLCMFVVGHSCIPNMTTLYLLSALISGCGNLPFLFRFGEGVLGWFED